MVKKMLYASLFAAPVLLAGSPPLALGQAHVPPKQYIDFATAQKMVNAAIDTATKANVHVGISVVDANGDLVFSIRLDGASDKAVTSSQGKARGAVVFGMPTKQVQDAIAAGKPVVATLIPPVDRAADLTLAQGGLPILRDGKVIGGIGVGGSPAAQDEKIAQAGIDAVLAK